MTQYNENKKPGYEEFKRNRRMQQQRRRKWVIVAVSTLAILLVILLMLKVAGSIGATVNNGGKDQAAEPAAKEETASVTLMATGDNLIHNTIYEQAAARAKNGGYDFDYDYAEIKPLIANADLVFVNQETPVATSIYEPSNYPLFNTPQESVTALKNAGFNLFNLASNHTLDKGSDGMAATIDFMDTLTGCLHFGAYRNYTDENTPKVVEKNGMTLAFIGVTEMTNGMSLPADAELDVVYTSETEKIQQMVEEARAAADVVVLSVHWGDENQLAAADRQKEMAQTFADMGVDLIIGHHPHVLQEIETLSAADGRKVPVVYSLGNFISAMRGKANHVGGFFGCTITKKDGAVSVSDLTFTPIVNYFTADYQNMRVIPFADYTDTLAASHGLGLTVNDVNQILLDTVGSDFVSAAAEDAA